MPILYYRQPPAPQIVTDGLMFNLDAGNLSSYPGTGSVWYDLSGNGRDATFVQDRYNLSNILSNPSYDGNSFTLSNEQAAYIPDISTRITGSDFTAESIFYFTDINTTSISIQKRESSSPYRQWDIGVTLDATSGGDGKNLFFFINPDASNVPYRRTNYDLTLGGGARIIHVHLVNDTTSARLYLNGVLIVTDFTSQPGATFNIAGYPVLIGYRTKTYITRLYNKALTQQEVTQNFEATRSRFGL